MRTTTRSPLRRLVPSLIAVAALALAACGDGEDTADDETGPTTDVTDDDSMAEGSGSLTVGGANFTEMLIMQEMYAAILREAGYDVEIVSADNREIYAEALAAGDIDVVPEYAATFAEYVNREVNGPDAEGIATTDAQETVDAAQPFAEELGLTLLTPAQAANQNAFVTSEAFATENDLSTLSDLGALGQSVVVAAPEECPDRPFCGLGLVQTYGIEITDYIPLDFGSPQAKQAVADGDAQLALTGTTDATLDDFGLVLLEDDQGLQLADNLVPVVNQDAAADQALVDALNALSQTLTTEDLTELNRLVDAERLQPADVALAYLEEQGLITA